MVGIVGEIEVFWNCIEVEMELGWSEIDIVFDKFVCIVIVFYVVMVGVRVGWGLFDFIVSGSCGWVNMRCILFLFEEIWVG